MSANWYFMIASTFLITTVGSLVSLKIVEPALGPYEGTPDLDTTDAHRMDPLNDLEKKGLWRSLWATLAFALVLIFLVVPEGAVLRNQETGEVAGSPFLRGIVAIIFVYFMTIGIVYGRTVGTIRSDRDVIDAMAHAMSTLGTLYRAGIFRCAVRQLLWLDQSWRHDGRGGRQLPAERRFHRTSAVFPVYPRMCLHQPDAGVGVGTMGRYCTHLCADVDAPGLCARGDPGGLSHR